MELSNTINLKLTEMPLLLKVVFGASLFVGTFQFIGLFNSQFLPSIDGIQITSPIFVIALALGHITLGIGLWLKQKWAMFFLILLPTFQFGIFYLASTPTHGSNWAFHLAFSCVWVAFFWYYCLSSSCRAYFGFTKNA